MAATIGGIVVGVAGVLMRYGLAGMTLMIGDFFSENTEAAWLLIIVIVGAWYMNPSNEERNDKNGKSL